MMLLKLDAGRVRAGDKVLCSVFIPVEILGTDENRHVQFEKDAKGSLLASKDWPTLAIIPMDVCIKKDKCAIVFIWVWVYPKGTLHIS